LVDLVLDVEAESIDFIEAVNSMEKSYQRRVTSHRKIKIWELMDLPPKKPMQSKACSK